MPSFNQATIMGNLTRDPEVKYTPKGTCVCNFGLAVNRRWKDDGGALREETTFVDFTAFGKSAENIGQYLKKGEALFVQGRLQLDVWEKDGEKFSKMVVIVEDFRFITPKPKGIPSTLREDS